MFKKIPKLKNYQSFFIFECNFCTLSLFLDAKIF